MILTQSVNSFPYGLIDTIDEQAIPQGAASRVLNWLSMGDRWELRRGMQMLGDDFGAGKVTGLHIMRRADGTEIPIKKVGRKLLRYNASTDTWIEIGTNLFPAAAEGDDMSAANYNSLAGAQCFICSPNSGLYKIMVANPGDYTDLTDNSKNFKGYIDILFSRIRLWQRNEDPSGIYGSYIDNQQYTTVSAEALADVATGTLAFKGGSARRTCFGVTITASGSGEVFTDDYNGILTGSLGHTGTINYTTGAYTTTASGSGTADYQWENSTNQGLGDFTKSSPRTAGQGFVFRQDDGGKAQNIFPYGDSDFCPHEKSTYELKLTNTDTNATNLPFREKAGIPNWRAGKATADGIIYIDNTDQTDPQFRVMSLEAISSKVLPKSISKRTKDGIVYGVELSAYEFDMAVVHEWGDYVMFGIRRGSSTENDRMLIYHKKTGAIDVTSFWPSCFATYDGALIMGDSITGNAYTLFSGWSDDDSDIENYLELDLSDLDIEELKKCKRLILKGKISPDQSYDVYVNLDNSGYTKVGTIEGSGSYVDRGQSVSIGSTMVGEHVVGGGSDGTTAYYYEHPLRLSLDKFKRAKLKFQATGVGYVSIDGYEWFDIRRKGAKTISKYR